MFSIFRRNANSGLAVDANLEDLYGLSEVPEAEELYGLSEVPVCKEDISDAGGSEENSCSVACARDGAASVAAGSNLSQVDLDF